MTSTNTPTVNEECNECGGQMVDLLLRCPTCANAVFLLHKAYNEEHEHVGELAECVECSELVPTSELSGEDEELDR
jgi:hypothetical protein